MTTAAETAGRIRRVMSDVFGVAEESIRDSDSPATITAWDSVGHLQLMLALEQEFGVQFEADEFATLASVAALEKRLGGTHG